jgi:hypothetical protein
MGDIHQTHEEKKMNNHFQFIIGKIRYIAGKGFTFTNEARDLILFQPLNQGY